MKENETKANIRFMDKNETQAMNFSQFTIQKMCSKH